LRKESFIPTLLGDICKAVSAAFFAFAFIFIENKQTKFPSLLRTHKLEELSHEKQIEKILF
jgi:hypothetical protein